MVSTDDPHERTQRAIALARTYGGDRDGWERVEEFQRVQDWRGKHPERGSSAASTALDLPRSRIRPWFSGSKPDPVHAVEAAERLEWLDAQPGEPVFEALVTLNAWIFAGGSITTDTWSPSFTATDGDPRELAETALELAGVPFTTVRPNEPGRAPEIRATETGSILGRFLFAVLGAPVGEKSATANIELPEWVADVPTGTQLRWVRTYVALRATPIDAEQHGYALQITEERSQTYRESLAELFRDLVGDASTVGVGDDHIWLRPAAADLLDSVQPLQST